MISDTENTPLKFPLFFGSTVVLSCFIGMVGSIGAMLFTSLGVMVQPLSEEFGWSRGEISAGILYLTLGILGGVMISGPIIDRYGSRRVVLVSIILSIIAVISGSFYVDSLPLFYLMLISGAVLGAPTNTIAYARVIASWFDRRRGLFIGINAAGMGTGFALVPILTHMVVSNAGWRAGYIALGIFMLVVVLPVVYLFVIDTPEEVGHVPDGKLESGNSIEKQSQGENYLVLQQAVATPMFWLMLVILPCLSFALHGTLIHIVPMLTDRGVTPALAAQVAGTVGISMACARIIFGFLLDHVFAPRLAIIVFLFSALGITLFLLTQQSWLFFAAAVCIGFGIGAEGDLMVYLVSRYYGMREFAKIFSYIFAAYMIGTGFGPKVFGSTYDRLGNYDFILQISLGLIILSVILFCFFVPYNHYRNKS